jgi:hypothetical protein
MRCRSTLSRCDARATPACPRPRLAIFSVAGLVETSRVHQGQQTGDADAGKGNLKQMRHMSRDQTKHCSYVSVNSPNSDRSVQWSDNRCVQLDAQERGSWTRCQRTRRARAGQNTLRKPSSGLQQAPSFHGPFATTAVRLEVPASL